MPLSCPAELWGHLRDTQGVRHGVGQQLRRGTGTAKRESGQGSGLRSFLGCRCSREGGSEEQTCSASLSLSLRDWVQGLLVAAAC